MTYVVIKKNKRMYIAVEETGDVVYGLPNWLRSHLRDREELGWLASMFNSKGYRDIVAIIVFEAMLRRRFHKEK